jgi:hypothetical protein
MLLAFAFATRPSFALDSLALAVPLLSGPDRFRRVLTIAVGGVAGLLGIITALWIEGSLGAYLTVVMPADHSYVRWANEGTTWPLVVRLAFLAATGALLFRRTRTLGARLATVWLLASVAGSSITPREITHYSHEAIPAIALAVALVASRPPLLRWRIPAFALAAVFVVLGAEMVIYLPGDQTSLESGLPAKHVSPYFSWTELPAYYANWFDYAAGARTWSQYSEQFPGSAPADAAEARLLRARAGPAAIRLTVIGDRPWLFVDSGGLPASRFIATNSAFWQVSGEPAELAGKIRAGCAGVVVYEPGSGDWRADLEAGGYQPLEDAPWPTYLSARGFSGCP